MENRADKFGKATLVDAVLRLAQSLKRGELLIEQPAKQVGVNPASMEHARDSFAKGKLCLAGASEARLPNGNLFHVL